MPLCMLASSSFFVQNSVIPEEEGMDVDSSVETSSENPIGWNLPKIEESNISAETSASPMKRFINILDQLDTNVERLRREARELQDKRDSLLMSMDLIRNNENFFDLNECAS
ncbi:hypothetical protein Bhyg_02233 [Pseudolycoriella hygida]|uniref:Uncharacterized protein n=1 Tax=Pseudolycoriella hygida TaxID=35572 RepID=A0A9Q0S867_9DIPT|nr:hypothetical protein Bhyg_02233 [Pseudolycoriella hygida]